MKLQHLSQVLGVTAEKCLVSPSSSWVRWGYLSAHTPLEGQQASPDLGMAGAVVWFSEPKELDSTRRQDIRTEATARLTSQ